MGEKKDSFRFTVQFNAGDPSHQQVAAILNEQGRRKAQFLVNAVTFFGMIIALMLIRPHELMPRVNTAGASRRIRLTLPASRDCRMG